MRCQDEFPNVRETWHLHHLFEKTIRHKIVDRFPDTSEAIRCAERVKMVIEGGYPPLELLSNAVCPACGWGSLVHFPYAHTIYANPNIEGHGGLKCNYCNECFYIDFKSRRDNLSNRTQLN